MPGYLPCLPVVVFETIIVTIKWRADCMIKAAAQYFTLHGPHTAQTHGPSHSSDTWPITQLRHSPAPKTG